MKSKKCMQFLCLSVLLTGLLVVRPTPVQAAQSDSVSWNGPFGTKIRKITFFNQPAPTEQAVAASAALKTAFTNVIDSPPVAGFVPWTVMVFTDQRLSELELQAVVEPSIQGSLTATPVRDKYALGILDTGASAHVLNYENALTTGIYNTTYLTENTISITGVTGSVDALVSMPLGVFIKGLSALDPNSPTDPEAKLNSTAGFKGQSNVSIIVGDYPLDRPDLVSAIGSPLSVYYTTWIRNDQPVSVVRNGRTYSGPDIVIYDKDDPNAPSYTNKLPLELRPLGAADVQYTILLSFEPASPSIIIGNLSQSLFFVHGVDLTKGSYSAIDKGRFMLDTGAQITTIGSRIAARLALDTQNPDFSVDIQGVTGDPITAPGFFLDSIQIPALGQWLQFSNVPVVLLDIFSPEGGTLDGIIGMNLFTQYNLILRGGGFLLKDDPVLEFELISTSIPGDIAPPPDGDGRVDMLDLDLFSQLWLTTPSSPNWNQKADLAPPNDIINIYDLFILAEHWLMGL